MGIITVVAEGSKGSRLVDSIEKYEKPTIKKVEKMTFPTDWIKHLSKESQIACRQCSSCHGCR